MPTFAFTARSMGGRPVRGRRQGASEAALALALEADGLFLLRAEPMAPAGALPGAFQLAPGERALFLLHLVSYLEAGLPLLTALQDFRDPDQPRLEAASQAMGARLAEGERLSTIMEACPGLFPPLHVAMVRAGETLGRLDKALRAVLKLEAWDASFRAQVRRITLYPLVLLVLIAGMVVVVCSVSLPAILKLLEDFAIPLPRVTRLLLWAGHGLRNHAWLLVALPTALGFGLAEALRRPVWRLRWDTALLALPMVGPLLQRMALARFAHFFAEQFRAGIPIVLALRACEEVSGNARTGQCIRNLRLGVEQGGRLGALAERAGCFPPVVVRMLALGESTGHLEEALEKMAEQFDGEVDARVRLAFAVLDPVVKVLLGCLLVVVASAVLLPLYTLVGGIND